mmetsp:Transcript_71961/g.105427  ORF Transcript_71961/g.105427 Transcript_71961/m.105427 type:complete len:205 (-) Transcript_71961:47-661(-)
MNTGVVCGRERSVDKTRCCTLLIGLERIPCLAIPLCPGLTIPLGIVALVLTSKNLGACWVASASCAVLFDLFLPALLANCLMESSPGSRQLFLKLLIRHVWLAVPGVLNVLWHGVGVYCVLQQRICRRVFFRIGQPALENWKPLIARVSHVSRRQLLNIVHVIGCVLPIDALQPASMPPLHTAKPPPSTANKKTARAMKQDMEQ